jgi:hypothetical protein
MGQNPDIKWVHHRQNLTCHRDVVFSVEAYGDDASARLLAARVPSPQAKGTSP